MDKQKKIVIYQPPSTAVQLEFTLDSSTSTDVYLGNTVIIGFTGLPGAFATIELIWSASANRWYLVDMSTNGFFVPSDI